MIKSITGRGRAKSSKHNVYQDMLKKEAKKSKAYRETIKEVPGMYSGLYKK